VIQTGDEGREDVPGGSKDLHRAGVVTIGSGVGAGKGDEALKL